MNWEKFNENVEAAAKAVSNAVNNFMDKVFEAWDRINHVEDPDIFEDNQSKEKDDWKNYCIMSRKTGKWFVKRASKRVVLSENIREAEHWGTKDEVWKYMAENNMSEKHYAVYSFEVEIDDDGNAHFMTPVEEK